MDLHFKNIKIWTYIYIYIYKILFSATQFIMAFVDSCTWLESPLSMTSSRVQSSAYLFVLIVRWSGIESSRSFIWTLNSIGEMTEPWGTPAGQGAIDDMTPCKFTCWVLPVRKHFTQDQKALDIFISASLNSRILWSTKSKALRKSRNIVWTPFPPSLELSVTSYQFCIIEIRAETVVRPLAKACWLFFISRPWT